MRDDEIRNAMDEAVLAAIKHADSIPDKDSKEYGIAIDNAVKLYRPRMETAAKDCEYDESYQKRLAEAKKQMADEKFRQKQFEEQKRQFDKRLLVDAAVSGVKLGLFVVVGRWSAVLEGGGVIASGTAKNLIRSVQKFIDFKG